MTDEKIKIAIAEACGWCSVTGHLDYDPYWECTKTGRMVAVSASRFPSYNYCNDLNAMHEAEKVLNEKQWVAYWRELYRLNVFPTVHATARQRAEAFLRTIGKWEESK